MRILKTALAVLLTIVLSDVALQLMLNDRKTFDSSTAVIVAIFAMQDTTRNTVKYVVERISGTLIGTAVAIIFIAILLSVGHIGWEWQRVLFYTLCTVGVIAVIYFCKCINKLSMSALAAFILVAVVYEYTSTTNASGAVDMRRPYILAVARLTETIIGLMVALAVNRLIAPPKTQSFGSYAQNVDNLYTIVDNSADLLYESSPSVLMLEEGKRQLTEGCGEMVGCCESCVPPDVFEIGGAPPPVGCESQGVQTPDGVAIVSDCEVCKKEQDHKTHLLEKELRNLRDVFVDDGK
ncbi:MAG: FUSC family protein [Firmicutes bacterium]|nr:FUSC family protein [Bacillota bacterium]